MIPWVIGIVNHDVNGGICNGCGSILGYGDGSGYGVGAGDGYYGYGFGTDGFGIGNGSGRGTSIVGELTNLNSYGDIRQWCNK